MINIEIHSIIRGLPRNCRHVLIIWEDVVAFLLFLVVRTVPKDKKMRNSKPVFQRIILLKSNLENGGGCYRGSCGQGRAALFDESEVGCQYHIAATGFLRRIPPGG